MGKIITYESPIEYICRQSPDLLALELPWVDVDIEKPGVLEAFFEANGAFLESSRMADTEPVYTLLAQIGLRIWSVSRRALWEEWCTLLPALVWHQKCAGVFLQEAMERTGAEARQLEVWWKEQGQIPAPVIRTPGNIDAMGWPWTVVREDPYEHQIVFSGVPWTLPAPVMTGEEIWQTRGLFGPRYLPPRSPSEWFRRLALLRQDLEQKRLECNLSEGKVPVRRERL